MHAPVRATKKRHSLLAALEEYGPDNQVALTRLVDHHGGKQD
ncbi:MAG TPA: hypothetical protein VD903_22055 [Pseudonocardia sp.]|nr:hypothetical protein [Pseudonocardia sp.]